MARMRWRLVVLEALVWLALASLALRLLPFRRLAPLLGPAHAAGTPDTRPEPDETARRRAVRVAAAVERGARALPWPALCLPRAMAAKAMLARRGLRTTLHLGASREGGLNAHAWLMLGSHEVTGGAERAGYAELARFG